MGEQIKGIREKWGRVNGAKREIGHRRRKKEKRVEMRSGDKDKRCKGNWKWGSGLSDKLLEI